MDCSNILDVVKSLKLIKLLLLLLTFWSCSENEITTRSEIQFSTQESAIAESMDSVVIQLLLDQPVTTDCYLFIELLPSSTAELGLDFIYEPLVKILTNSKSVKFTIYLVDDAITEPTESFQIMPTTPVGIGFVDDTAKLKHKVTIEDDDVKDSFLKIDLSWDAGDGTAGDVDMDLILWIESPPGSGQVEFVRSSSLIGTDFESLTLPGDTLDGRYAVTFNYYEGSSDHLTFTVDYTSIEGTIESVETQKSFTGIYSLANVNCCDSYAIEQAFTKSGQDYSAFSEIDIPSSGSRVSGLLIPASKSRKK